jgi:chorismate-pyruvate lyase
LEPNVLSEGSLGLLYPLDEFYARSGEAPAPASPVEAEEVPQPYRRLLVHADDMTPTLEAYHGEEIHLRVLGKIQDGDTYSREVVLLLNESGRPVEFGAIVIHLAHFPPAARRAILEGWQPLGTILRRHQIRHRSAPQAFLRVTPDAVIRQALGLTGESTLYGRHNVLLDGEERLLAEIIEILPPVEEGQRG